MLIPQQSRAKEAARRRFTYPHLSAQSDLSHDPDDATPANPPREIAQLLAWEKLNVGGGVNHIDAAIAEVVDDQSVTCSPEITVAT